MLQALIILAALGAVTYFGTPSHLARDVITNIALGAASGTTYDVEVSGTDWITVQGDLTGGAATDLAVTVTPYEEDNVTITALPLTEAVKQGPTLSGGHVYYYGKFDVTGIGRVRIRWANNNAGAQTLTRGSWRTRNW
jgi:hypothetical protein